MYRPSLLAQYLSLAWRGPAGEKGEEEPTCIEQSVSRHKRDLRTSAWKSRMVVQEVAQVSRRAWQAANAASKNKGEVFLENYKIPIEVLTVAYGFHRRVPEMCAPIIGCKKDCRKHETHFKRTLRLHLESRMVLFSPSGELEVWIWCDTGIIGDTGEKIPVLKQLVDFPRPLGYI